MTLLNCVGLVKDYPGKRAVDGVDFHVNPGEIVGLLGPNGAGKSTSFSMTCGLIAPTDGRVFLKDTDVTDWPMYKRARLGMGYLPQQESIFGKLTVEENMFAILEYLKIGRTERMEKTERLLGEFGLLDHRHQTSGTLSSGEKRRLEIARCLASDPELILLDEPFTGIDPRTIHDVQDIIKQLRDSGIAILLTDHRERETLTITDRNYIICQGKVVVTGSAETVLSNPEAQDAYFGRRFDANSIIEGKEAFQDLGNSRLNAVIPVPPDVVEVEVPDSEVGDSEEPKIDEVVDPTLPPSAVEPVDELLDAAPDEAVPDDAAIVEDSKTFEQPADSAA